MVQPCNRGFFHVPAPSLCVGNAEQRPIMRPAQFVTQRVTDRKGSVEETHVAQVRGIESASKFDGKRFGQRRQETLTVLCPVSPTLFELNDLSPNLPTGLNLNLIHGARDSLPGVSNQHPELT